MVETDSAVAETAVEHCVVLGNDLAMIETADFGSVYCQIGIDLDLGLAELVQHYTEQVVVVVAAAAEFLVVLDIALDLVIAVGFDLVVVEVGTVSDLGVSGETGTAPVDLAGADFDVAVTVVENVADIVVDFHALVALETEKLDFDQSDLGNGLVGTVDIAAGCSAEVDFDLGTAVGCFADLEPELGTVVCC